MIRSLAALSLLVLVPAFTFAHEVTYTAVLTGDAEVPAISSPGTGTATVTVDLDLATMRVQADFSGLDGNVTAAHIHCCTPPGGNVGVATPTPTFPGFPSGVTSGTYDMTFDLSLDTSYNAGFITNHGGTVGSAMTDLIAGLDAGEAYLNIHTSTVGSGEIRGLLRAVPEPTGGMLALSGALMCGILRKRWAS